MPLAPGASTSFQNGKVKCDNAALLGWRSLPSLDSRRNGNEESRASTQTGMQSFFGFSCEIFHVVQHRGLAEHCVKYLFEYVHVACGLNRRLEGRWSRQSSEGALQEPPSPVRQQWPPVFRVQADKRRIRLPRPQGPGLKECHPVIRSPGMWICRKF